MIAFIILFFPAVITTRIYESVKRAEFSPKQWICRYCVNNVLINFFCFLVKCVILKTGNASLYTLYADVTPAAAMNYLIMALPAAILLGFMQVLLSKTIKVEAEIEKCA